MKAIFNRPTRTCKRCGTEQNSDQFAAYGLVCTTCKMLAVERRDKRKQVVKDSKGRPKLHKPIA